MFEIKCKIYHKKRKWFSEFCQYLNMQSGVPDKEQDVLLVNTTGNPIGYTFKEVIVLPWTQKTDWKGRRIYLDDVIEKGGKQYAVKFINKIGAFKLMDRDGNICGDLSNVRNYKIVDNLLNEKFKWNDNKTQKKELKNG